MEESIAPRRPRHPRHASAATQCISVDGETSAQCVEAAGIGGEFGSSCAILMFAIPERLDWELRRAVCVSRERSQAPPERPRVAAPTRASGEQGPVRLRGLRPRRSQQKPLEPWNSRRSRPGVGVAVAVHGPLNPRARVEHTRGRTEDMGVDNGNCKSGRHGHAAKDRATATGSARTATAPTATRPGSRTRAT